MDFPSSSKIVFDRAFPFRKWLQGYNFAILRIDAMAGLTVAVVLIPQAMAYAMLAGLPPIYGLYAAAVTPLIGALWGSLRQLATGPIAIMSLLVLTTLTPLAEPGSPHFIQLCFLISFMVGGIYLIVGFFQMGQLMAFISHSAVKGFTSAAALIIMATQIPHLLGIPASKHEYIFPMLVGIVKGIPSFHPLTTAIGIFSFVFIYTLKKYRPRFPAGLIALVLTTIVVYLFDLQGADVAVIGKSQGGLPQFRMPMIDPEMLSVLFGPAVVIALVSFAETYSVGKAISSQTKQKVDVNQEFIGQGLANLVGSFFQCYPVAGSFSRTAINFASGAKTGISSVISSVVVVLALLFLTPLFTHIPKATLAALVISAVLLLFHPLEVLKVWRMNRNDGAVALTVFILALVAKPDYALLIGVLMSLIFFLWKTMHPRIVRVTKDPDLNMFLNADFHGKPGCPQILHLRSDNVIYFANAEYTTEQILEITDRVDTPLKFLLLDFQSVGFIDLTGIEELSSLHETMKARGIHIAMLEVHRPVREALERSGLLESIGETCELEGGRCLLIHKSDAITALFNKLDHGYCRDVCPHSLFQECRTVKKIRITIK
jgi:SulP family sulfate permease